MTPEEVRRAIEHVEAHDCAGHGGYLSHDTAQLLAFLAQRELERMGREKGLCTGTRPVCNCDGRKPDEWWTCPEHGLVHDTRGAGPVGEITYSKNWRVPTNGEGNHP